MDSRLTPWVFQDLTQKQATSSRKHPATWLPSVWAAFWNEASPRWGTESSSHQSFPLGKFMENQIENHTIICFSSCVFICHQKKSKTKKDRNKPSNKLRVCYTDSPPKKIVISAGCALALQRLTLELPWHHGQDAEWSSWSNDHRDNVTTNHNS